MTLDADENATKRTNGQVWTANSHLACDSDLCDLGINRMDFDAIARGDDVCGR
jgi:hypothetical protein